MTGSNKTALREKLKQAQPLAPTLPDYEIQNSLLQIERLRADMRVNAALNKIERAAETLLLAAWGW